MPGAERRQAVQGLHCHGGVANTCGHGGDQGVIGGLARPGGRGRPRCGHTSIPFACPELIKRYLVALPGHRRRIGDRVRPGVLGQPIGSKEDSQDERQQDRGGSAGMAKILGHSPRTIRRVTPVSAEPAGVDVRGG